MMLKSAPFIRVMAAFLVVTPVAASSQLDALRKAKDIVRGTPSLESLFGGQPPITTSIEDARDGVPMMDGFEPESWASLAEMPRGQDGSILLVPGAYVMVARSFCLKPGTYGPQKGDGYLHTEWKGPKAKLITTLITRYADHPEIDQYQMQMLLWAIIARADFKNIGREQKLIAARLLTPSEMVELSGYGLSAVPDAVGKRVLQSVPAPVRRVMEAENEMRRLFVAAESKYADMERVAVLNGAIPASEATYVIPRGRWSYHPAGVFIRYAPFHYSTTRVDIFYPDSVEIRRDAAGRIISVGSSDGSRFEPGYSHKAQVQLASLRFSSGRERFAGFSRLHLLDAAMRRDSGDAKDDLLILARADYLDLAAIREDLESPTNVTRARASDGTRALIGKAMLAALARYHGIARLEAIPRGSAREASLRPRRTADGFKYVVAPVATNAQGHPGRMRPIKPSNGGATGPGPRQRLGLSPAPMKLASGAGPNQGSTPDAMDKAKEVTDKMQAAMDVLGAATDPAGTLGGKAPFQPGSLLGSGLDAAYSKAREIFGALGGNPGSSLPWLEPGRRVALAGWNQLQVLIPVSSDRRNTFASFADLWVNQGPDYETLSKPRTINLPELPGATTAHARALNTAAVSTFRMAMALEAWAIAQRRFDAAVKARNVIWQDKQGLALVHLKRTAGLEMVKVADDLEAVKRAAPPGPLVTEAGVQERQAQLRASGFSAAELAVAKQLGWSSADLEVRRRRLLALDPTKTVSEAPGNIEKLKYALKEFGSYLALLPEVAPPWETATAPR